MEVCVLNIYLQALILRFRCSRVAELEQENARLLALAENGRGNGTRPQDGGNAEIERLRAQLAAAEERERELSAELERKATSNSRDVSVKVEVNDPRCPPPSPIRCTPIQSPHKSGASLGLMVCTQ
jgi:hypothetical protein